MHQPLDRLRRRPAPQPGDEDHHQPLTLGPPGHQVQHAQAGVVGQMHVVHHQDDRSLLRDRLEQLVERLRQLDAGSVPLGVASRRDGGKRRRTSGTVRESSASASGGVPETSGYASNPRMSPDTVA